MSPTQRKQILTHAAVLSVLENACEKAVALKRNICVSVCDQAGHELGFIRMPLAPDICAGNAQDKAYTAGVFGVDSKKWDAVLADEHPRVFEALKRRPRFTAFGGGLPIIIDGELVGGVGVSGASEEEDELCAQAGLSSIGAKAN